MRAFLTGLKRGAAVFLGWWGGELAALVPGSLRRGFQSSAGQIVFDVSGAEIAVVHVSARSRREVGRVAAHPEDPAVEAAALAPLIGNLRTRRHDVVLRMAASHALRRTLDLPRAAIENLRQVLTFEIDRQTPFSAAQVYFDFIVGARSPSSETIGVELVACPRPEVDAAVERARAWGIRPDIVDIADGTASASAPARINLLPGTPERSAGSAMTRLTAALAVVALVLAAAAVYLPLDRQRRAAELAGAEAARARVEALAAAKLRETITELASDAQFLAEHKRTSPGVVEIVDALTRLLPDDTWLQQLRINGDEVRLTGFSAAASSLIGLIEQSERFSEARFRSSVTRDTRNKAERFTISAKIVAEKQP